MALRKILLRVMLVALAVAALAGVAGVMLASGEVIWRIVGTAIATAVAVGLMLPFTWLLDRPATRVVGLWGMVWVVGMYVVTLVLIWEMWRLFDGMWPGRGYWGWEGRFFGLLGLWAICGLAALALLGIRKIVGGRVAGDTGLVLDGVVFVLLNLAMWNDDGGRRWGDHLGETGAVLAGIGVLAVVALVGTGRKDRQGWRWAGVAAAAAAWVLAVVGIWRETHSKVGEDVLTALISAAAAVALANGVMLPRLRGGARVVPWGAAVAGAGCALAIDGMVIWEDIVQFGEVLGRVAAGLGIVAGCAALATLVLWLVQRLMARGDERLESVAVEAVSVICPRCGKRETIALGEEARGSGKCGKCGLGIEVKVTEARCACGYLLYGNTSGRCPECGKAIGDANCENPEASKL